MLPRPARLRSGTDVRRASRGRRSGSPTLVTSCVPTPPGPAGPRVAFAVGRAVGRATARNRVRRRLRHLVAARLEGLGAVDVVVRALPPAAQAPADRLAADLDRTLARCGATR